jgi:hypothetical protein
VGCMLSLYAAACRRFACGRMFSLLIHRPASPAWSQPSLAVRCIMLHAARFVLHAACSTLYERSFHVERGTRRRAWPCACVGAQHRALRLVDHMRRLCTAAL